MGVNICREVERYLCLCKSAVDGRRLKVREGEVDTCNWGEEGTGWITTGQEQVLPPPLDKAGIQPDFRDQLGFYYHPSNSIQSKYGRGDG